MDIKDLNSLKTRYPVVEKTELVNMLLNEAIVVVQASIKEYTVRSSKYLQRRNLILGEKNLRSLWIKIFRKDLINFFKERYGYEDAHSFSLRSSNIIFSKWWLRDLSAEEFREEAEKIKEFERLPEEWMVVLSENGVFGLFGSKLASLNKGKAIYFPEELDGLKDTVNNWLEQLDFNSDEIKGLHCPAKGIVKLLGYYYLLLRSLLMAFDDASIVDGFNLLKEDGGRIKPCHIDELWDNYVKILTGNSYVEQ